MHVDLKANLLSEWQQVDVKKHTKSKIEKRTIVLKHAHLPWKQKQKQPPSVMEMELIWFRITPRLTRVDRYPRPPFGEKKQSKNTKKMYVNKSKPLFFF